MSKYEWMLRVKGGPGSGNWGHAGRPGQVGGSSPGGGLHAVGQFPSEAGEDSNFLIGMELSYEAGQQGRDGWYNTGYARRGEIKDKIASNLSTETPGVSYEDANKFVRQWAASSNDSDMRSLAIQQDAAKEFGVPLSDFTKGRIKIIEEDRHYAEQNPLYNVNDARLNPIMESSKQRAILRTMYKQTQDNLRSMGIGPDDVVTLYRGVKFDSNAVRDWGPGKKVRFHDNAVSSWSVGSSVALDFAERTGYGQTGVSLKVDIPARNILSMAHTGFGCMEEGEVTVLGARGVAEVDWVD